MGQFWTLYNLDKKTFLQFSDGFKLAEWFFGDDPTRILTQLRRGTESWAGDRIICFGDYATSIPEGVMTKEEVAALLKKGISLKQLKKVSPEQIHIKDVIEVIGHRTQKKVPEQENFDYSNYVLRNLSKKMFVRGDNPPAAIPEYVSNSFGQMLFAYICWSDDPSTSMTVEDHEIIRGEWAGDRFDVVRYDLVEDELNDEGWIDRTEEIKQRVEGLYIAQGLM